MNSNAQTTAEFAEIWDKHHVSHIQPSDVRHADLKKYLEGVKKTGVSVMEVGRSYQNREIYQMEWGHGPLKVFMWSQMHGDEPTATSALIDMFTWLQNNRHIDWVKKLEESITLRAVPMLNPDGQEIYQRRSALDIDINRDAVDLKTPEAQLLKRLRDEWKPDIGFNLHNQQERTTVGNTPKQASISLLVVYGDAAKTHTDGLDRNRRLCGLIVQALNNYIPGHIARYDDEYTSTAFGDNFSAWGTPVILIETGALEGKDELYLVKMNFIAFLTSLNALAAGSEKTADSLPYDTLQPNSSGRVYTYIFRNASIVDPFAQAQITSANIAINRRRTRFSFVPQVEIVGVNSLAGMTGLIEYDTSGFYVMQKFGRLKTGESAELLFFKKGRTIDWLSATFEKDYIPDAVFSLGKFIKGGDLVPTKNTQ